jgi:hypothetical protein
MPRWILLALTLDLGLDGRGESDQKFREGRSRKRQIFLKTQTYAQKCVCITQDVPTSERLTMMCFLVELRHVVPRFGGHEGPARIFARDGFHGGVPPDPRCRLLHPGFGTLRSIEVSLGASRNPASTCALDCPPICRGKESDKTFSKTTIRANVFSVGTATSRRQGAPAFRHNR